MTEKRFTTDYYNFVRDDKTYIKDNDVRMTYEQIVDLLNKYVEENEQLKSENQYLKSLKWNQDCINEISINMQQKQLLERQNNEVVKENEKLKSDIILIEKRADTVYDEIEQIKKDLKVLLPILLAIDFKMSVNECKVMNRLAELLDDDFVKGVDVND